ncbi:hypothetical protein [Inquilinus sp. CAU 1745]|uniref:hypothetical protein n=1 Tax=Inquilinus sp. CAU 1745 TaxID=3140369 RepID=UPI00325B7913
MTMPAILQRHRQWCLRASESALFSRSERQQFRLLADRLAEELAREIRPGAPLIHIVRRARERKAILRLAS